MDIKDLNKPQMILLVILVSFVISIGTGVSVVSLMQPEPTTVTQTINKVIRHTIENVENDSSEQKDSDTKINKDENTNIDSNLKPLVDFYSFSKPKENINKEDIYSDRKLIGKTVLVSDTGILLVNSNFITEGYLYQVVLGEDYFNVDLLSKIGDVYVMQVVSKADKYEVKDDINIDIDA